MRGYQTTIGRRLCRAAGLGLMCLALAPWAVCHGQVSSESTSAASAPIDTVEIALTADRVRHWEEDGTRHVLLEGHASAFKGDAGIRSERALVKIVSAVDDAGKMVHHVDVIARGKVTRSNKDGPAQGEIVESWSTTGNLKVSAADAAGLKGLEAAPRDLNFGEEAPKPAAKPVQAPAPAPRRSRPAMKKQAQPDDAPPAPVRELPPLPQGELPALPPGDAASLPPATLDSDVKPAQATADTAVALPAVQSKKEEDVRPIRLRDPAFKPVQFLGGQGFPERETGQPKPAAPAAPGDAPPPDDFGPSIVPPVVENPANSPAPRPDDDNGPGTELMPLPGIDPDRKAPAAKGAKPPIAPILPGTQRITSIYGRVGPNFTIQTLPTTADGTTITVIRGGANIVTEAPKLGMLDVEADNIIIWRKKKPDSPEARVGPDGAVIESQEDPMEVYMEGHVLFRQDRRVLQGKDDQTTYHAERAYFDYRADRFTGLDAQVDMFAPGLLAPYKLSTPRVEGFHPLVAGPGGQMFPSTFQEIHANNTSSTGSRFPTPGYKFDSKTLDMKKVISDNIPPGTTGDAPNNDMRTTWRIDARSNWFYMGPVPVFFWPRFVADIDDLQPPLRNFSFRTNNYFGQQLLLDFNAFKIFNIRRPSWIDQWNLDIDYLSARGLGVGTEAGWYGKDPIYDILDPYHKKPNTQPSILTDYFGYFDIWGLQDKGRDVLGPGPAVVTANVEVPAGHGTFVPAGLAGYQRISVPSFQETRGRMNYRQMQSLMTPDDDPLADFRFNAEVGFYSDRQFLEQYYKRLYDIGLDHEVLLYGVKQKENTAITLQTEVNPNAFNTETQWLPKLDYYRLGDSLLSDRFTYFQHSGADYANIHTANEVNNKDVFAFIPYDPTSNTSGSLSSGRAYSAHELDMPVNLGFMRIVPYVQGQVTAWSQQLDGQSVGRVWGSLGARADMLVHKPYPEIESELLNVHGVNHKIDFVIDAHDAYSNVNLNTLAVQDDIDDNTYEFVRRYFAMTNFAGGLLPFQYNPRYLMLRRNVSPITGSTDIQGTIEMIQFGIHQRLQTKRGPEGKRRVIDYIVFDLDTTYFPNANRDNFGKPFGQNTYNFEWYIGDRTSIVSYGWFEFWNIVGDPLYQQVAKKSELNPFGMNMTTSGININRPPRGNVFLGYTYFNTGPIQTSALIVNYSYWMTPKWYTSFGASYDFGNFGDPILLGANASLTRIGKDYFMTVGLTANPLQHSYMFAVEITPRLSPSLGLGGGGMARPDLRYAPVQ